MAGPEITVAEFNQALAGYVSSLVRAGLRKPADPKPELNGGREGYLLWYEDNPGGHSGMEVGHMLIIGYSRREAATWLRLTSCSIDAEANILRRAVRVLNAISPDACKLTLQQAAEQGGDLTPATFDRTVAASLAALGEDPPAG